MKSIRSAEKSATSFQLWQLANTPINADIMITPARCTTLDSCRESISPRALYMLSRCLSNSSFIKKSFPALSMYVFLKAKIMEVNEICFQKELKQLFIYPSYILIGIHAFSLQYANKNP